MDKQIIIDDQKKTIHRLQDECTEKTNAIIALDEQLKAKEQELQEAMDNYVQLDLQRVKEYNELVDLYKAKEQECESWKKANYEKNEFLKKLGISATGEFHRIKYYINKLYQECEKLKAEVKKQKEIAKEYEQRWLNSYGV